MLTIQRLQQTIVALLTAAISSLATFITTVFELKSEANVQPATTVPQQNDTQADRESTPTDPCVWPRHRALLIGLNYPGSECELKGCVNDVMNVKDFLIKDQLFDEDKVRMVCDTDSVTAPCCTRAGILAELRRLATQTHEEDLDGVWIHYSGHGTGMQDCNNDETDGQDEAIYTSDEETITDDELGDIVKTFNPRTRLTCVFDCCFSGTMLDLTYRWTSEKDTCQEAGVCSDRRILMLSGCRDDQTSADTNWDRSPAGALTSRLLDTLRDYPDLKVFNGLTVLREKLVYGEFEQIPQLCSSFTLDYDTKWMEPATTWIESLD